ncbi:MAG: carbon-nitrogen hydrolase family protein [Gammaproteobacteria bacterium]|jgi:nitrilase|nr:carbon-nitrogen hydrolase family protein [Gammaproteobacteria bacterium]MBT4193012.1 carbon-nitrogen hydrolase family protein [Gammaproteobacteria bacterium]MBT4451686.1 carbon-nitrogen hydrolase family protein [Gammaproteobacteria bacterium]MBT4861108.1 carbon-nitrogen hydrolase family protein [Gammaproteobacteria bacterium]MBT6552684.1 carbon-nitrogen hydrolase family protein [Gammaproteobacteria bacterium]
MSQLAIVQTAPIFLDKTKTIELAVSKIEEAAERGADLVVFSEAFIPGYPAWVWRLRPGGDWNLSEQLHERLLNNAINMKSDDLAPLYQAAKKHQLTVVCGIEERDSELSRSTLFNSVIVIGPEGTLLNKHRKLMPTNPERMVWGFGDGSGLKVVDTPAGRIGTLLCWENYMPLARYALYSQGVELYIAPTYDSGEGWIGSLQHIAREGCCWVVGCGNLMKGSDIPDDFPEKDKLYPDAEEWVNPGDSVVIAPGGEIIAGPLRKEEGILYCEIDPAKVGIARRALDVAGHYSRPDIFQLHINTKPQSSVLFENQKPG